MPTFTYAGKTRTGAVAKGKLVAKTREEAAELLRRRSLLVTTLQEEAAAGILNRQIGGGPTDKDLVVFTRQFATMVNAGLPLIQCLDILATQSENKVFCKTIAEVKVDVESGSTLTDAMKKHPKVFDELYVNMVHAGEVGGMLDGILVRLAKHIEKAMKLKSQIKGAMIYPAAVLGVSIIVIVVLMIWVIPVFEKMFHDMSGGKAGLPAPTQFVIDVSQFFQNNILSMVAVAAIAIVGLKRYYATPKGRLAIDRLMLKLPVLGDLIRKAAVAKFTRTLGTLITSGVAILEGLAITAKTAGNKVVEEAILSARRSIAQGKTVSDPLAKSGVFPNMVTHMISVGESTGALDAMLGKIADFYDDEVDAAVAALTSLLEPMLMVFLGVTIGFIVIAMYLPIFNIGKFIG
jgi:type IV pilus assembly protein PilC